MKRLSQSAKIVEKSDLNGDRLRTRERLKEQAGFQILMGIAVYVGWKPALCRFSYSIKS